MPREPWPYDEARRILKTFPSADQLTLETGYGPSGAPHIGTFAEVARTSWVGRAIADLSDRPWTLIAFSDDMDGLRKVPQNMPDDALRPHLGKPLSDVPDPFGCHASYAAHNNSLLKDMLDRFGFRYDFRSSHDQYTSGAFNDGLTRIMRNYEAVRQVILPTIRSEKRESWSPFFPICEGCGRINGTRVVAHDPEALTVSYVCEGDRGGAVGDEREEGNAGPGQEGCNTSSTVSILDGHAKVGWKVDWALRWDVLRVHYEMYGKDLIESAALSAEICKVISGRKGPVQSFYEMFLDEEGRKISKSVGRGLGVDGWLAYAPEESLLQFIFKDPRKAKKLSWEAVARSVDEYLQLLQRHYEPRDGGEEKPGEKESLRTELGFIRPDLPERSPYSYPVSYSMLLGLVSAIGLPSPEVVMEYVHHYKGADAESDAMLNRLIELASAYARDHVLPSRTPRTLAPEEARIVQELAETLHGEAPTRDMTAEEIQTRVFDIARAHGIEAKDLFRLVYNLLSGQDSGPRLGTFIKLMGQGKVAAILRQAAAGRAGNGG